MVLTFLDRYRNAGLLILRVGLGCMFVLHGAPKIMGGPEKWKVVGMAMSHVGIDFAPVFWGFMAACSECLGGVGLILGFLFRPACFFMTVTMTVAATMHLRRGDGIMGASHAIEAGIVFLSLILIGPGRYSLDAWLSRKKDA